MTATKPAMSPATAALFATEDRTLLPAGVYDYGCYENYGPSPDHLHEQREDETWQGDAWWQVIDAHRAPLLARIAELEEQIARMKAYGVARDPWAQ